MLDVLVIGAGPAGAIIAAALGDRGLRVGGLSARDPGAAWPNTYGIWQDELVPLGLTHLLSHTWAEGFAYFAEGPVALGRTYGLFDNQRFQAHWRDRHSCNGTLWHQGKAVAVTHTPHSTQVTTDDGKELEARLVIDATGHQSALVQRPAAPLAYQAAYGVVGRFSVNPIPPGQFVLMDYRSDHLPMAEREAAPPTFLYAMDLGDGVFFLEETSLASDPPVSFDRLEYRLKCRLQALGTQVQEVHHVEHCLFPMTSPMPRFDQRIVGFGGAASMVHPASGYMVGILLRRAPLLAEAIATAFNGPNPTPTTLARAAWDGLWPRTRLRNYYLYRFGLEKLMRFEEEQLKHFFDTFFSLPQPFWAGFLADTFTTPQLVWAMLRLFGQAPRDVTWGLMQFMGREGDLLWQFLRT